MGRAGAGLQMKNLEGYHDSTAGKTIRRAHQAKRRARGASFQRPLTYRLGELPGCIYLHPFDRTNKEGAGVQDPGR